MRRGRGIRGATTVSGMLQGLKQRSKPRLKTPTTGLQINTVKNQNTGKLNRLRLRGKKNIRKKNNYGQKPNSN